MDWSKVKKGTIVLWHNKTFFRAKRKVAIPEDYLLVEVVKIEKSVAWGQKRYITDICIASSFTEPTGGLDCYIEGCYQEEWNFKLIKLKDLILYSNLKYKSKRYFELLNGDKDGLV